MSRKVIVDDTDEGITYTGTWNAGPGIGTGNNGLAFNNTLHVGTVQAQFSFSFTGSSLNVFGSINGNLDHPHWDCLLDGVRLPNVNLPNTFENALILCSKADMPAGDHQLSVVVDNLAGGFYFDYLEYTPSRPLSSVTVSIPHQDPAFTYSDGWNDYSLNPSSQATFSDINGSTVTLDFTGTSVLWYSFIPVALPHPPSQATYSIDGGDPVAVILPGLPPNSNEDLSNQVILTTPELSPGPHTLQIIYLGGTKQAPLMLGHVVVTDSSFTNHSTLSSPSVVDVPGVTTSLTTLPGGVVHTTVTRPQTTSFPSPGSTERSPHHTRHTGAIIGGILGGMALAILLIIILLWHKRKGRRFRNKRPISEIIEPYRITPGSGAESTIRLAEEGKILPQLPEEAIRSPDTTMSSGSRPLVLPDRGSVHVVIRRDNGGISISGVRPRSGDQDSEGLPSYGSL